MSTYELDSDVPCAYFSWDEYDFFAPEKDVKEKVNAMAMAISNCGGTNQRLEYIKSMMKEGLVVDSYGRFGFSVILLPPL